MIKGFKKYCFDLDRLTDLVGEKVVLTAQDFAKIGNKEINTKDEQLKVAQEALKDACILGNKLLFITNKKCLTLKDVNDIAESKEFIYRAFLKPDYEAIVEELNK